MKFYKESLIALVLLAILYTKPAFLSEFTSSVLGKLISLVAIIFVGHKYGKYHSFILALVVVILLHQYVEGMENKEEKNDEAEETDEEEESENEEETSNTDDLDEETENTSGNDQMDAEETLKAVVPSDAPQNENEVVEGFMNFKSLCSSCSM